MSKSVLNVKEVVCAFNQEKALVETNCEADGSFTALLRTGGLSAGKFDVYYYPPEGKPKCRSKPEMVKVLGDSVDLTGFDFSAGVFTSSIIKPRGGGKPRPGGGARDRASNEPSRRFHNHGEGPY